VSELAELYAVFVVLYLFECLAWVPQRTVGFFALTGRWRARMAFRPNASWSSSVVVGKPWPPLTPPWHAEPLPFAVDPSGITLTESTGRRLTWDELDPIVAGAMRVASGDQLVCKLASRQGAARLARALETVRVASPEQREAEVRRFLDASFDQESARVRWREFSRGVFPLRALSNALWLSLFGGLGLAVLAQNMLFLLVAAALTLLLWPIHGIVFARTLRRQTWLAREHWPDLGKRLVTLLSPLSAVRAVDTLARELWANLDPLAVAAVLLAPRDLAAFARPRFVAMQPRKGDALAWWRAEVRGRIERLLAKQGISVDALLAPPVREGPHVALYCPSCLSQYEPSAGSNGHCPNETCQDISLCAFAGDRQKDRSGN
jgi:hypothetical protein